MNLKLRLKACGIYLKNKIVFDKRFAVKAYVSAFMIAVMIVTGTASWFTKLDSVGVATGTFELESASTLNVSDSQTLANHITIKDVKLDEASSVDGRNMFFPTTDSSDSTANIESLLFREGTAGDENVRYIYKDFTLYGGSSITDVYIKSYAITVKYDSSVTVWSPKDSEGNRVRVTEEVYNGSTEIKWTGNSPQNIVRVNDCPLRVAFISNSQNKPVVLDPSAMVGDYAQTMTAVDSTDANGNARTKDSKAKAFSDYYHLTGEPVFTITGREPLHGTMVLWLEGASDRSDELRNATIDVDIELESVFPPYGIITFIDNTWGDDGGNSHWMNTSGDAIITMTYKDGKDHLGNDNIRTIVMKKYTNDETDAAKKDKIQISDGSWCEAWWAPLPDTVKTDITFNRYDATQEMIFNAWYTCEGIDSATGFTGKYKPKDNNDMRNTKNGSRVRLEEYRTTTGTASGELCYTYTALRGNGYSTTSNMAQRLSPCVGYWSTDVHYYGSGSGSSGGGSSGGGSTSSTESPFRIQIEMWKDQNSSVGQNSINWIRNAVVSEGNKMYVLFSDNNKVLMSFNSGENKLIATGTKTKGTTIKGFELYNTNGSVRQTFTIKGGSITMTHTGSTQYIYNFKFMDADERILTKS